MALGKILIGGAAIGGVYLAIPSAQPRSAAVFPQTAAKATARLEAKRRVVNGTGMGSLTLDYAGRDKGALLISVKRAGEPHKVKCRVTVIAETPDTARAETDCTQPAGKDAPMRALGAAAMNIVVGEHVAATVTGRDYDVDGVANRMIALVVTNQGTIAKSLSAGK
jgi:hypothetical protein